MPGHTKDVLPLAVAGSLLLFLSGCASDDALTPEEIARERLQYVPGESAIYCYQTLGVPDCYSEPQPGPPNRIIMGYEDRR